MRSASDTRDVFRTRSVIGCLPRTEARGGDWRSISRAPGRGVTRRSMIATPTSARLTARSSGGSAGNARTTSDAAPRAAAHISNRREGIAFTGSPRHLGLAQDAVNHLFGLEA